MNMDQKKPFMSQSEYDELMEQAENGDEESAALIRDHWPMPDEKFYPLLQKAKEGDANALRRLNFPVEEKELAYWQAFAHGLADTTLQGGADELTGGISALHPRGSYEEGKAQYDLNEVKAQGKWEAYVPGQLVGAAVLGRYLGPRMGTKGMAGMGGVSGFLHSEGDFEDRMKAAALSGLFGGATGAGSKLASQYGKKGASYLLQAYPTLKKYLYAKLGSGMGAMAAGAADKVVHGPGKKALQKYAEPLVQGAAANLPGRYGAFAQPAIQTLEGGAAKSPEELRKEFENAIVRLDPNSPERKALEKELLRLESGK